MTQMIEVNAAERNQCDGCQAGIPVINGSHRMGRPGGYPDYMSCTAELYREADPKLGDKVMVPVELIGGDL